MTGPHDDPGPPQPHGGGETPGPYGGTPASYGEIPPPYAVVPPPGQPPAPNRRPLIVGIVAGALVIIAVIVAVVLAAGSSSGSPKDAAQAFIDAVKRGDVAAEKDLVCSRLADQFDASTSVNENPLANFPGSFTAEVSDVTESGDRAVANLKIGFSGPNGLSVRLPISLS